jgi:hypothetical protein
LRKRTLRRSGEQTFALQSGNLAHFREDFCHGLPSAESRNQKELNRKERKDRKEEMS